MTDIGFPADSYTPHGYLANPFAVAHSWTDGEGGCLRTTRQRLGLGWQLPWALQARASLDLVVTLEGPTGRLARRVDFARVGLVSPHHSARLLVYRWEAFGRRWEASYTLVDRDTLGLDVSWQPLGDSPADGSAGRPARPGAGALTLGIGLVGWRRADPRVETQARPQVVIPQEQSSFYDDVSQVQDEDAPPGAVDLGEPYGRWELLVGDGAELVAVRVAYESDGEEAGEPAGAEATAMSPDADPPTAELTAAFQVGTAREGTVHALVRRASGESRVAVDELVGAALARAREDDERFWQGAARLSGDWPDSWRRGWVYDVETTRMCVYPAGGIFTDVWPAWMVQWPRAVVAEGTLDMARLAYASPDLAQRATLSLFRDAKTPNVPCVFQHGEPNMVAKDGSICGTSPAWCVPFYNLERLFAQTLDREWLAAIYPYLAAYVVWWLAERTDADGWTVYKCTWEAGEDDTPRLDPERRGDNVVSAFVRPVELQATMALSAGVLARFAAVLGRTEDVKRWSAVEGRYQEKTRELWDPEEGRFRDWDARAERFLAPAGEANYWGIDPCRYSALAFTPLLAGLGDDATRAGLRRELQQYDGPPWTLWASWSYVVLEAAPLTGDGDFAGRVAAEIVGRVYDELDAREPGGPTHPIPGVSREYWPLDLSTWASCEGYGWGANTASLLVRQVFGFVEGPYADPETPLTFVLRPSLPETLLVPGREYRLENVPYRGARLSLGYRVGADGQLTLLVSADGPTRCRVTEKAPGEQVAEVGASERHEMAGRNGGEYVVELWPAP
ncbi:MAG: hypothetical protein U0893_02825 [Chloroflexota bacterium]